VVNGSVQAASYAEGGAVLGRTRDFMKEPDAFTSDRKPPKPTDQPKQDYEGGKPKGNSKSLKPITPGK
jgi:hypothetical protein